MSSHSGVLSDGTAAPVLQPVCCGRPMSSIAVTEERAELALVTCSSCSRHGWVRDGALLDRDGMLAAVKERLAEAPRPKGGRPRGSGTRRVPPQRRTGAPTGAASAAAQRAAQESAQQAARARRIEEMKGMLSGFEVHGG